MSTKKQSDELNEILMNSLATGILAYTIPDRKVLIFNDEAKNIFKLPQDFNGDINHFISDEIMKPNADSIRDTIRKIKKPGDVAKYQLKIPVNDTFIIVDVVTKLLQFGNGEKFILSTMQDVTEKERLSKMLFEERRQYRDALIKNSEYFYSFDVTEGYLHDDIILPNGTGIISSLGLPIPVHYDVLCKTLIEKTGIKFLSGHRFDSCDRILKFVNEGIFSATLEHYMEETDEYTRTVMLFSKNKETDHIHAFVVATDITKERRKEVMARQALIDAYNSATRANKAKTEFLSRMSHDIRTPMNAIIGMTALANVHLDDKKRVQDCLGKITVASNHLLGLINDVLDMSKIESGRIDLQVQSFKISELIDTIVTISRPQIEEKNHKFLVNVKNIKHHNVKGDSQRLEQILMNLISNAIKYTPKGGEIKFSVSEKSTNKENVGCYEFIVEDNGIGMTPEYVKKMFDPFSRAEDERISKIQGTGLGMSIAKNLIQMMNGDIKVESEVDKGTKIIATVYLELDKGQKRQKASSPTKKADTIKKSELVKNDFQIETTEPQQNVSEILKEFKKAGLNGKRVLLVEDNEINLEIAKEIFTLAKLEVETAQNGKEAVDKMNEVPDGYYDIVFMDIQMPIMTGHEATRAIRKINRTYCKEVPIIAMTANAFSDDIIASKNAGMNAHIAKPLRFDVLLQIMKKWISQKN